MTPCHISLYGGDRKIAIFPYRGDHKIKYLFDRGDRKILRVKFPRFFSPPPPVVNDVSLRAPSIQLQGSQRFSGIKFHDFSMIFHDFCIIFP